MTDVPLDGRGVAKALARYREPSHARSIAEITVTAVPFLVLWSLTWASVALGWWWGLLLTVPAAGFLVRLFMIQHDCGHGAFFRSRRANDWVGRVIGVLAFTPYDCWKRTHAAHHATVGNLDRRGMGDITIFTVLEYQARSQWGQLAYRLYRNPIVMFGLGPTYLFLLHNRLPIGLMRAGWRPWFSAMATNLAIMILAGLLIWAIGLETFLLVQIPVILVAATIGVWLFYVQHQFEDTSWARNGHWNLHHAALHGSSHYDLPIGLRWLTANIGVHHLHHLNSRIPFYRLGEALHEHPALHSAGRLTLLESFRCTRLVLWDESRQRLVSFREAHTF